jgi:hypothetical protein
MAAVKQKLAVQLDINSPIFLVSLFGLPNEEKLQALKTLQKISQLTWHDVYQDQGLKWEKITSVKPDPELKIDAIYSLRINNARRATAYRDGNFMRFLTIAPDHDATYGKK